MAWRALNSSGSEQDAKNKVMNLQFQYNRRLPDQLRIVLLLKKNLLYGFLYVMWSVLSSKGSPILLSEARKLIQI
jgi:hypothetical protein